MPVVSKPVRVRNVPPIVGPRPYKKPKEAWPGSVESLAQGAGVPEVNGSETGIAASPTRPKGSILKSPTGEAAGSTVKPTVTFSNENVCEEPPELPRRRCLHKPSRKQIRENNKNINGECTSSKVDEGRIDLSRTVSVSPTVAKTKGLSLAETVKACEEHTDWANSVLSENNLPLISDLRKSIGDGFTLPAILEIIGGVALTSIQSKPQCKEERVGNIRKCLIFLGKHGVDITGLDPAELEDGDLSSVLVLIGNIRKHFKTNSRVEVNNNVADVGGSHTERSDNMPGAVKLPGAVPTPFQNLKEHNARHGPVDGAPRFSAFQEVEMLPGMMGNGTHNSNHNNIKPHSNLISTTELGINGVSQHGVDERKSHFAVNNINNNSSNNRGVVIRHPNAKNSGQTMTENSGVPPSAAQRAWMDSPVRHNNVNGVVQGPSVEDRLRELITKQPSSTGGSRENMAFPNGGGGYFHCGGSEVFDLDGEMLDIPPPAARSSADFDSPMLGDCSFGPGYRHPTSQHERQRSQQGYVPSRPTEKLEGSRADIIRSRPPSAIAFRQKKPGPQVASFVNQNRPRSAMGELTSSAYNGGHDNSAYIHDNSPKSADFSRSLGNNSSNQSASKGGASNDLRSACNRLYGGRGQVPPYQSPQMKRGDNFRSSRGQQGPNVVQNNMKDLGPPPISPASRPQSAPAPAHMQSYFMSHERLQGQSHSHDELDGYPVKPSMGPGHTNLSNQRESPTGQSTSTQGHLDESSSSQQSKLSQDAGTKSLHIHPPADNTRKSSQSSPSSLSQPSPHSPASPNYAIGPASKYPDNPGSRPSSARKAVGHGPPALPARSPQRPDKPGFPPRNITHNDHAIRNDRKPHNVSFPGYNGDISGMKLHGHTGSQDLTTSLQAASKEHRYKFNTSHDQSHDLSQELQNHSIFDYNVPSRSESTGSVTPPLPPLSPTNTPPDSLLLDPSGNLPRSISATNVSSGDMTLTPGDENGLNKRKPRRTSELHFRMAPKPTGKKSRKGFKSKGANLNDVQESDSGSNLSFDIDDTFLTIESHDMEQPHPAGDLLSSQEVTFLKQQYNDLEFKYHDLQTKLSSGSHFTHGRGAVGQLPIGRQRRWSIGSSDTSSFRRESEFKPGKSAHHKHHSREFKNINKRFQKLESHVVTLARSVAHLSNELRTHNTMVNDLESVKRQLQELKDNPSRPFPNMLGCLGLEHEKFREGLPGLTNPKRVNKLTKFFGSEPPLLNIFLEKLGYQRYLPNFQSEHIGMIELPYMTEDRLEKIGVPMGPRIRILQEAQLCFRQENLDVYMV